MINPEIKKTIKRELNSINQDMYNKLIKKDLEIQLEYDFCEGPISGRTHILKFANFERFFCYSGCRTSYKEKYNGRIEALKKGIRKMINVYYYILLQMQYELISIFSLLEVLVDDNERSLVSGLLVLHI